MLTQALLLSRSAHCDPEPYLSDAILAAYRNPSASLPLRLAAPSPLPRACRLIDRASELAVARKLLARGMTIAIHADFIETDAAERPLLTEVSTFTFATLVACFLSTRPSGDALLSTALACPRYNRQRRKRARIRSAVVIVAEWIAAYWSLSSLTSGRAPTRESSLIAGRAWRKSQSSFSS